MKILHSIAREYKICNRVTINKKQRASAAICNNACKINFEGTTECPNSLNHCRCAMQLLPLEKVD